MFPAKLAARNVDLHQQVSVEPLLVFAAAQIETLSKQADSVFVPQATNQKTACPTSTAMMIVSWFPKKGAPATRMSTPQGIV